jgi:glycerol dehydrogenase
MRIFTATPRYIQGPGALALAGKEALRLGSRPAIVIDAMVRPLVEVALLSGFPAAPGMAEFSGEITDAAIARLGAALGEADVIVAVGGGKALDAGKGVAFIRQCPVITVPTIASTDGPASSGIAVYDDTHRLIRVDQLPVNPAAVIVDSRVIANAPVRFLRAGIGDAIAKKFEAESCAAGGGRTKNGTRPSPTGLALADTAYKVLRAHAVAGVEAACRHDVTEDLEATIEAAVLLSALGFENGGLSIAHSMTRGLTALRAAKDRLHGEQVAYGTMMQLAVEARGGGELADMAAFLRAVGLPATLRELGVDCLTKEEIPEIAAAVMNSPHIGNLAHTVTQVSLETAIARVETF